MDTIHPAVHAASSEITGGHQVLLVAIAVVVIASGAVAAIRPDIAYRWSMFGRNWQFRGGAPEPTDFRLVLGRVGGVASIVAGIALVLVTMLA